MTALSKYQRLECPGIWHPSPDAQRQDVFVSLGEASLIIKDANDVALAHWSLPAVARINALERPALYVPGDDADELLEIDDSDMIDAIRTVARAISASRARPGRLRGGVSLAALAVVAALGIFWLPDATARHAADLMPAGVRGEIGQRLLQDLEPYSGAPCSSRAGIAALALLNDRLFDTGNWSLLVVPDGPVQATHLPGGIILLRQDVFTPPSTPDIAAGLILAEAARAQARDPVLDLIDRSGLGVMVRLLTRGEISDTVLEAYAADLLVRPPAPMAHDQAVALFAAANVSSRPYQRAVAPDAGPDHPLLRNDPFPDGTPAPILGDAAWFRLGTLCDL